MLLLTLSLLFFYARYILSLRITKMTDSIFRVAVIIIIIVAVVVIIIVTIELL